MKRTETVFAPARRIDFGEALLPPEGYSLEAALGTTFSMDFLTALTVPVSLALRNGVQREELLTTPLAALAAMRRLQDRLAIYVESGNIHAPKNRPTALVSLLENVVKEVTPPKGASFHPKLWLLRFAPENGGAMRQRLIIMSRNLTRDRAWDVALRLEGEEQTAIQNRNAPLVELLEFLDRSSGKMNTRLRGLREGLGYVRWDRVPGFSQPSFHAHHPASKRPPWRPDEGRLAVVSPFCDDPGLEALGVNRIDAIVACDDWLAALTKTSVRSFTLAEHALPEPDPETAATAEDRAGLHAKLYIVESGDDTAITIGSGNATGAGLGAKGGRNIEVFATLRGKSAEIGAIGLGGEGFLGTGGIGPLLKDWRQRNLREDEVAGQCFDDAVREARRSICAAKPLLTFSPDGERLNVKLSVELPALPKIPVVKACLVTQRDSISLSDGGPWDLGSVRLADATTFIRFDLHAERDDTASFVTQAKANGLPDADMRLRALLSDMVKTPEQFFAFVTAMLEKRPDISGMMRATVTRGTGTATRVAMPVLESLLTTYLSDDGPSRLNDLDRVVSLMERDLARDKMQEFLQLWAEFKKAIGKRK